MFLFETQIRKPLRVTTESLDADDFAVEVIGCEQGVGRKQLSVQEERSVLRVGFEDL